jgi:hypothetical protein
MKCKNGKIETDANSYAKALPQMWKELMEEVIIVHIRSSQILLKYS